MRHTVIGTAGHIDHGKSALVKALTGTDPDRLKEEKEREITIDLGFAFLGDDITFIDVPGHEKFIKNMAAGVSAIDMVILVIAADDGIMPQTREHFEILDLMGVKRGMIVISKIDIVEKEWLELVEDEIKELVKGTFLDNSLIMKVSNTTGEGIEELKQIILLQTQEVEPRYDKGLFCMWVDRIFTIKGSGTIIAGTVLSGECKTGDTVELLPQQKKLRVRRVQVHNKSIEKCVTGERAAINLMDIKKEEIQRGNMIAEPGYYGPSYMLNARLHLLESSPFTVKNRMRIRLHLGTGEIIGRIILLEREEILPGQSAIIQFRLEAPAIAECGHRYVIRSFSPARTIGGGTIIEVHPPKLKYLPEEELRRLTILEKADPKDLVEQKLLKNLHKPAGVASLSREMSLNPNVVKDALEELMNDKCLTVVQQLPELQVIHEENYKASLDSLLAYLGKFHKENPIMEGINKAELKERVFQEINSVLYDMLLNYLAEEEQIELTVDRIKLTAHSIKFTPKQKEFRKKIEKVYLDAEFITPGWDEISSEVEGKEKDIKEVVKGLIEIGVLIEVKYYKTPAIYHKDCIDKAEKILVDYLNEHGEIRLGEYRELISSTRKFATPVMVYFDRLGITERDDEIRRLKNIKTAK